MPGRVVDTSVLAAMVFTEPRADEAADLLGTYRLFGPTLLADELASVCRRKIQQQITDRASLLAALDVALRMDIEWVDVEHGQVVAMALDTGLTTYAATYLWLARSLDLPLLTFDQQLQQFC